MDSQRSTCLCLLVLGLKACTKHTFFFQNRVSPCHLACHETHTAEEGSLKLIAICLPLPPLISEVFYHLYLSVYLSIYLSIHLSISVSIYLYMYLSIHLILYLFIFCFFKTGFLSHFGVCPIELGKKDCSTTTIQLDVFFFKW